MKSRGHFNPNYQTYTLTDMYPRRPWFNFLWNKNFIAQLDQFGFGQSWHYTDEGVRANHNTTGTRSDLGTVMDNRLVFIRDMDDSSYWAANRNYHREAFEIFQTEVEPGITRVHSLYKGIECVYTLFVPSEGSHECWQVTIKNKDTVHRSIRLFTYAQSAIALLPHSPCAPGDYDTDLPGVILQNKNPKFAETMNTSYMVADTKPDGWETTDRRFRGVYGIISDPDAVQAGELANRGTNFEWQLIAALQFNLDLNPDEEQTIRLLSGISKDKEPIKETARKYLNEEFYTHEQEKLRQITEEQGARISIGTGDIQIDPLANVWLKRQVALGKTWGRVYGRGFRDIMQDCTALVSFDPEAAATNLCACLAHQYPNGNTLRQWNPPWKHPYRDGSVWTVPAVCGYIKETGDFSLLDTVVPYLDSDESGSVLDHTRRGMNFLLKETGAHGLCLWGGGDWNDSLDQTGLEGKGESIWLSQATVLSGKLFVELLNRLGLTEEAEEVDADVQTLADQIRKHGCEANYFACGINDPGHYVGGKERLFLNPQTWAVLSEVADNPEQLMDQVEAELKCDYGYVLAKPSYTQGDPYIGLVSYMMPGCCENGSVYCHGNAFKIAADCKLGRAREAYETLKKIMPGNPLNPDSGVEAYAATNQYLGPENRWRAGDANGAWITGTAGWLYRCITEFIVGMQADYDGLRIDPCLPKEWDSISAKRIFRNTRYDIRIRNTTDGGKPKSIKVDGAPIDGLTLPLFADKEEHLVEVEI